MVFVAKEQKYVLNPLEGISVAKEQKYVLSKATRIALVGDHGVGKTWIAREICDSLVKKNLISGSLWLSLNRKYNVYEDIAQQLSVFSTAEQEYQDDETNNEEKKKQVESNPEVYLRKKIREKLEKIIPMRDEGEKHILLILDGIPDKIKYKEQEDIISKVRKLLPQGKQLSLKLLITKTVSKIEYLVNYLKEDQADTIELVDWSPGEVQTGIVSEIHRFLEKNSSNDKGKTKMATGKCLLYKPLRVSLTKISDARCIHGEIERQLFDQECGDRIVLHHHEGQKDSLEVSRKKIWEKLQEMASSKDEKKKYVLLILEDVPNEKFEEVISTVESLMCPKEEQFLRLLKEEQLLKVLVTRCNTNSAFILQRKEEVIEIEPLSKEEILETLQPEARKKSLSDSIETQFENIFSTKLPAAVVFMIEEAMKGIGEHDSSISVLENVLLEAANIEEADKIKSLARCGYEMLPSDKVEMIKCFWHSRELFAKPESIHYNELITYWMMEGYFDPVDSIEKAYEKGHDVLMELQRRCILKLQEDEFVSMERLAMDVPDRRRNGVSGAACLGLSRLTLSEKGGLELDLGRITLADGMIKSICNRKKREKFTTLVINGSRLHREVPKNFFRPMQELKILVLLKPRLKSLDFLESLVLRILVLRGCEMLENIDHITKLESLEVLEISGARSLKKIPDEVFAKLTKLQSLNLSALPIESLGTSFSKLTELRLLILRHCTCLKELPSLTQFQKLEVLDLFGACSFKGFVDGELNSLLNLKMLDLSHTQIEKLPVLNNFRALTQLSLRDCKSLTNLRKLRDSSVLRILDLSGATALKEVRNEFLTAKTELRILDLSRTKISGLPSNLSNLSSLEVLDLSHMSCFEKTEKRKVGKQEFENEIDKVNFDHLKCLRQLNLSNTKVKQLPSLSGLSNLRELLLMDCQSLKELPEMQGLKRLEILNLSGACLLGDSKPDMDFGNFGCLHRLNLSKTKVQKLLSLSNSLCELLLKDCEFLKKLPDMKGLKRLEKLDLSGASSLEMIPDGSFSQMSNLRQLLLPNCVMLRKLPALGASKKLEVIDLLGCNALTEIEDKSFKDIASLEQLKLSESKIEELPSLSNLEKLSKLLLGNCSNLKQLPSLESLSNLQQLDLSGAKFLKETEAKFLEKMTKLRQLSLANCSSLDQLPRLEKLVHLETLDIQGITVKEFPYWISKLIHLKSLHLPDLRQIQELDWGKIKRLPDVLNWEKCGIFTNSDIHFSKSSPYISVSGTEIFQFLNKDSNIWDKCFKDKFHISVCSSTFSGNDEYVYCLRDEFQDFHFNTLSCPKKNGGSMEIRGFDKEFPSGVEEILKQSIYIFLTENQFIKNLSDIGQNNIASMKGLWLESCGNMESIFCESKDIKLNQSLEILWVSNLVKLESLYRGKVQVESFKNLKHLYINCCPKLEKVFTLQQLPENLEILEIKFCDRLKTLFQPSSEECVLEKLRELNLVELPELSSIGIRLPSLENIKVRNCPILEMLVGLDRENEMQQRIRECYGLLESARVEVYRSPDKDNLGMCLMGRPTEPQKNLNSTLS